MESKLSGEVLGSVDIERETLKKQMEKPVKDPIKKMDSQIEVVEVGA